MFKQKAVTPKNRVFVFSSIGKKAAAAVITNAKGVIATTPALLLKANAAKNAARASRAAKPIEISCFFLFSSSFFIYIPPQNRGW